MRKKQLAVISLLIIFAIGVPLTLFIFNQQQELRSRAEKSTTLYFSPDSSDTNPIQTQVGNTLPLDIMVNPGANLVSLVKLEILYDSTKFEITETTAFQANMTAISKVVEGPLITPGKLMVTLSIGTDLNKVINKITRVANLKLKALNSTAETESTTSVTYGPNTQVLAIGANASANENVLSNTQPAIIAINPMPLPTCMPRPICLDTAPKCLISEPAGGWCTPPPPPPTVIPTGQPISCKNATSDIVLIIDRSGSMSGSKFKKAKEAAKIFIDKVSSDPNNKIAITTIDANSTLLSPFTNNFSSLKSKIDSLNISGGTCVQCGVKKANTEIANGRAGFKKVAILLTDGRANRIDGKSASTSSSETAAIEEVKKGFNASKTVFYTIGLGSDVSTSFLNQIANLTGGKYYFAPAETQLNDIYTEISQVIPKGAISGFVFNDANNNKAFDQNESKLPGWTVNLFTAGSNTAKPFISDNTGTYNATKLCDGSYTVKEILKTGWTQTLPTNPNEYTVNITNGSVVTGKNFGNYFQVTPTVTPVTQTTLLLNALLDGIGSRGDNSNPEGSLSNKKPLHPTRSVKVNIFDTSNKLVSDVSGTINYSSASGSFTGSISSTISSGNYTIKVTTDNHLTRLLPGIQNLKSGQNNKLPDAIFITGDAVIDNKLDIRDYNILLGCYSDLKAATNCKDNTTKNSADFNDDGAVNQFDYNLFLRELATQPGQ